MGNNISPENRIASVDNRSSSKEVIGGALFEKIETFRVENAEKITGMLLEMPVNDLEKILEDDRVLKEKIDEAIEVLRGQTKEQETQMVERKKALGNIIYADVESIYPEEDMAAKITGMLLEMCVEDIENLTRNRQTLLDKVHEAANVLITTKNTEKSVISESPAPPSRNELGEKLFGTISRWYPDEEHAAKLTGMILEMNINEIVLLAEDEELLKHKVDEAEQALRLQ